MNIKRFTFGYYFLYISSDHRPNQIAQNNDPKQNDRSRATKPNYIRHYFRLFLLSLFMRDTTNIGVIDPEGLGNSTGLSCIYL